MADTATESCSGWASRLASSAGRPFCAVAVRLRKRIPYAQEGSGITEVDENVPHGGRICRAILPSANKRLLVGARVVEPGKSRDEDSMLPFRKILVARDYSPCSDEAFVVALDLADRSGAEVHTLFAEVIHGPVAPPPDERNRGGKRAEKLVVNRAFVRDAAAAPAVLRYADENDIDLIVMGTHGRRGLRRLFLGSVSEEVIRLSKRPVLTVRLGEKTPGAMREILVPIDFSDYSENALREAVGWAAEFEASLDLLHVVEEPLHPAFYNTGVFSIYDIQPDIEERVEEHLRALYEKVGQPQITVRYNVVPGRAGREIVRFAEERKSGLVVTSTHGLTGIEHLLIGGVAEKVARMAPCPVLVAKPFREPRIGAAHREEEAAA